jgi:hypothetical protein
MRLSRLQTPQAGSKALYGAQDPEPSKLDASQEMRRKI